jgi:hypothetical protein
MPPTAIEYETNLNLIEDKVKSLQEKTNQIVVQLHQQIQSMLRNQMWHSQPIYSFLKLIDKSHIVTNEENLIGQGGFAKVY